ncbi:MAG: histidine kinase [Bacteroidia bacterium]|nr:histidine kinase [Bacteroidia bacterium]
MERKKLYWICQIGGWLFFTLINIVFLKLTNALDTRQSLSLFFLFVVGIAITHLYRSTIVRLGWLRVTPLGLIPRVIAATLIMASVIYFFQFFIEAAIGITDISFSTFNSVVAIQSILNIAFVLFFWSLIYFLIHSIENYKKSEIENLKWQASINEIELNKLKSQLNPHFMFNAMNSIRALVEENPRRAKESINQLSNILRNTLTMGRNKVIAFNDEFSIVKDYIQLESTRYEERLRVEYDIDPKSIDFSIPPLLLQTLVENAIKHGISKLPNGGNLILKTEVKYDTLYINIKNSGQINIGNNNSTGFGLKNSEQRLQLLYGNLASLKVFNCDDNNVLTELMIPKQH